ncbi:MAG: mechanosensitive ion channel [Clostridia bacterium]|nr:mechanosensitive ion channel [Clostridia bacterium]
MDATELMSFLKTQGIGLLRGILVLVIGFFVVHYLLKFVSRHGTERLQVNPNVRGFLDNAIRIVLYVTVVLTAANVMGIPLTSIVTLLASAGVAVSLAMQGALSNVVGGLMLLILQPMRVGEYVKIGELEGTVDSIGAFYSVLVTPDNRSISLPNSGITNTAITNYSRTGRRRMELIYSVSYGSDVDQVKAILLALTLSMPEALKNPAPEVHLKECADSALVFTLRVWALSADYWTLYWALIEQGKKALDAAGISIPYPQMDIHVHADAQ